MALDSGGHPLCDEYGKWDGMTPETGIITDSGMTVAIYLTKLPTRGGQNNQEIHLLRLKDAPDDVYQVYVGRN